MSFKIKELSGFPHEEIQTQERMDRIEGPVKDGTLLNWIWTKGVEKRCEIQKKLTEDREKIDFTEVSPLIGFCWLSSLSNKVFIVDSTVFPFLEKCDLTKEELIQLVGEKKQVCFQWVELSEQTWTAICALVAEGKIDHLTIRGGMVPTKPQFLALREAISTEKHLKSLELGNLQLTAECMIEFCQLVPQLKQLKTLTLESNGIGKEVIAPFKKMLEHSPHLNEIKLTFAKFKSIEGLGTLFDPLKSHQKLDLSANWDYC